MKSRNATAEAGADGHAAHLRANRLGILAMIGAMAWIPWVLWAALGVLTKFRPRDVAFLALLTALQLLAGQAEMNGVDFEGVNSPLVQ